MKRKTFDHTFFKYLISYLLILLIPILFINGLFGHRFMKAYKKEIQEQANTDLINLGQMMDSELQTIATTADPDWFSNSDLTGNSFKSDEEPEIPSVCSNGNLLSTFYLHCCFNRYALYISFSTYRSDQQPHHIVRRRCKIFFGTA